MYNSHLLICINISCLQRMAALHNVLHLTLHLADMQPGNCEFLLQFTNSVHIKLEVQL